MHGLLPLLIHLPDLSSHQAFINNPRDLKGETTYLTDDLTPTQVTYRKSSMETVMAAQKEGKRAIIVTERRNKKGTAHVRHRIWTCPFGTAMVRCCQNLSCRAFSRILSLNGTSPSTQTHQSPERGLPRVTGYQWESTYCENTLHVWGYLRVLRCSMVSLSWGKV
eukprot:c37589_g1_i1 orf=73-567(+)